MQLPQVSALKEWPSGVLEKWNDLEKQLAQLNSKIGHGSEYQQIKSELVDAVNSRNYSRIKKMLAKKVTARALTQLWADDEHNEHKLLSATLLHALVESQKPRLGRLPIITLIHLFFNRFDQLDHCSNDADKSIFRAFAQVLREQLSALPIKSSTTTEPDIITRLQTSHGWLLDSDSPNKLVDLVRANNLELDHYLEKEGIKPLIQGRYSDVCRGIYYLEKLKMLAIGSDDTVFSELLKPEVNLIPFGESRCIGHAALEILIDRSEVYPGDVWQQYILNLAGDPRIASTARNYRQWWLPLGEARIEKVRGWLSKEDLKLFLQAVEQYGIESESLKLQRMFPARKYFLLGLQDMGVINSARLMLGGKAETAVTTFIGKDLKTNFISLKGSDLSDKAIIYLDCGNFFIIEGSHDFKMWVYLAPPNPDLTSYETRELNHQDLTKSTYKKYHDKYKKLSSLYVIHDIKGAWQNKVIDFLYKSGANLEIELLFPPGDYEQYIRSYGLPYYKAAEKINEDNYRHSDLSTNIDIKPDKGVLGYSHLGIRVLSLLDKEPGLSSYDIVERLHIHREEVMRLLYGELSGLCNQDSSAQWKLNPSGREILNLIIHSIGN